MSKTLSNILTVFKVAKIVAKVVFILTIIGGAGCLIGLVTLPLADGLLSLFDFAEEGFDLASAYLACIVGAISCAGEAVFAFLSERYFANVLNAGTPFTLEGAKESFRLGIASIIISVAISVLAGIASIVLLLFTTPTAVESGAETSISISVGLFFLFMSLIFKYGSELQASRAQEPQQEAQSSELESN